MNWSLFPTGFPPAEPAPSGSWGRALAAALSMGTMILFLYWPAVDFRMLAFDDIFYTTNKSTLAGLDGPNIVRVFTELPEEDLLVPMTQLSFMADVELFGMTSRGFHFTNIIIFAVDMALLILLLWRMTGAFGKSVLASALVALHPMRVESVAWVTERKDVLSFLFLILSMLCYLRYARTRRWVWYGALLLCTALGLLAKPILVTMPFLLFLVDFWPLGRFRQTTEGVPKGSQARRIVALVAEKVPLMALSAIIILITLRLQQIESLHQEFPLFSRIGHACAAVFIYLFQTIWPLDLKFQLFDPAWTLHSPTMAPAFLGLAVVTAIVFHSAAKRPWVAFGWGWYLVALFPVSGIMPSGMQWLADRYTFIPHVGLAVASVWLVSDVPAHRTRKILAAFGLLLLVPLAFISRRQLIFWRDGAALFGKGFAYSRQNAIYVNQYSMELFNIGDYARALEQAKSIQQFAMSPGYGPIIQHNYLEILKVMGDRKGAIAQARKYLDQDPRLWKTRLTLADDLLSEERFSEAALEYRRILKEASFKKHDRAYILEGLAGALVGLKYSNEAQACLEEALRANPVSESLHYNLARVLANRGEMANAQAHYAKALRIAPDNLRIRMMMAEHLLKAGVVGTAALQLEEVARRAPGKAEGFYAQGRILEGAGMTVQARSFYETALKSPSVFPDTVDTVRRRLAKMMGH